MPRHCRGHCQLPRSRESSVIDVQATASSAAEALKLADAGAKALQSDVVQVTNDSQAQLAPIMAAFQKADTAAQQATAQTNLLQHQLNSFLGELGNHPVPRQLKVRELPQRPDRCSLYESRHHHLSRQLLQ